MSCSMYLIYNATMLIIEKFRFNAVQGQEAKYLTLIVTTSLHLFFNHLIFNWRTSNFSIGIAQCNRMRLAVQNCNLKFENFGEKTIAWCSTKKLVFDHFSINRKNPCEFNLILLKEKRNPVWL